MIYLILYATITSALIIVLPVVGIIWAVLSGVAIYGAIIWSYKE